MKFRLFSTKKFLLYFILSNFLFLLSNTQIFARLYRNPPFYMSTLQHFTWTHDYNLYVSAINQGANGEWLFQDRYTSEQTKPSVFYIYYVFIGKIGKVFNLSPYLIYHIFRVFSVEIFLFLSYILCTMACKKTAGFWGAIFALLGSIAPLSFFQRPVSFIGQPWWTDFESVERLNTLPHNMVGMVFLLLSIVSFLKYLDGKKISWFFLSGLSIFIGGIIFPPVTTPFIVALPLTYILLYIRNKFVSKKIPISINSFSLFIIILIALLSIASIRLQEQAGFPWNIWTGWNVARWNLYEPRIYIDVFLILGILPILALPSLVKNIIKGDEKQLLISFWALSGYILLPFANILHIPILRLFQNALYLPWGILAADLLLDIYQITRRKSIFYFIVIFFFMSVIPTSKYLFDYKLNRLLSGGMDASLPDDFATSLNFLKDNIPKNSVILTMEEGLFIPVFTNAKAYVGHMSLTKDFNQKMYWAAMFYNKNWDEKTANDFLKKNKITYVFNSYTARENGLQNNTLPSRSFNYELNRTYPFLTPIYERKGPYRTYTIYKVN